MQKIRGNMNYDIIVVGGGTAGMTAALNILRNGKSVLVIEQESIGGQISYSPRVENFPTIPSISGAELSDRLLDQILSLGAQLEIDTVVSIDKLAERSFVVQCQSASYSCNSVILANGVKPRMLGIDGEAQLVGNGVSYCALCDGAFYANQDVVLVGDGNTALQYALFLSNIAHKVYLCTLFDGFAADKCHVETILAKNNVIIYHNVALQQLQSDNGTLHSMHFVNTTDNSTLDIVAPALFVAIGQVPNNDAFANLVDLDKDGYIVACDDCKTRTAGLFVAGDTRTKSIRQLSTAVADGAVAGISACQYVG